MALIGRRVLASQGNCRTIDQGRARREPDAPHLDGQTAVLVPAGHRGDFGGEVAFLLFDAFAEGETKAYVEAFRDHEVAITEVGASDDHVTVIPEALLRGGDTETNGVAYSNNGTSEVVMRNQFKAWQAYIRPAVQAAVSIA